MSYGGGYGGGSSFTMKVDSGDIGRIIGKGGSKIKELEQVCRVRIKIGRDEDEDGTKSVEISGSDDVIQKARRMIDDCISGADFDGGRRGGSSYGGGRGGGRGGEFGGRRGDGGSFGRRGDGGGYGRRGDGGSFGRRDRDSGDGWGRQNDDRGGRGGRGGFSEDGDCETIFVESSEVGRIIGRGGSRIRDMEADSGCKIKVSRDGDTHGRSSVELSGSRSAISAAKRLIQDAGVDIMRGDDRGRGW